MSRVVRASVIVILLVGAIGAYAAQGWRAAHSIAADADVQVPARLERLPLDIETPPFRGTRDTLDSEVVELSGADHYAAIDYQAPDGGTVRLHVGVSVRSHPRLHVPTVCMPSHGWTTSEAVLVPIWDGLPGADPGAMVRRSEFHKAGSQMLVYHWFQWGDRIVQSRRQRTRYRLEGLLAGEPDRPSQIVILYARLVGGEAKTEARVESLVRALWPHLSTTLSTGDLDHGPSHP